MAGRPKAPKLDAARSLRCRALVIETMARLNLTTAQIAKIVRDELDMRGFSEASAEDDIRPTGSDSRLAEPMDAKRGAIYAAVIMAVNTRFRIVANADSSKYDSMFRRLILGAIEATRFGPSDANEIVISQAPRRNWQRNHRYSRFLKSGRILLMDGKPVKTETLYRLSMYEWFPRYRRRQLTAYLNYLKTNSPVQVRCCVAEHRLEIIAAADHSYALRNRLLSRKEEIAMTRRAHCGVSVYRETERFVRATLRNRAVEGSRELSRGELAIIEQIVGRGLGGFPIDGDEVLTSDLALSAKQKGEQ